MGLSCSKKLREDHREADSGPAIVRLSPFRPRRCNSARRQPRCAGAATADAAPSAPSPVPSLLSLALHAAAASVHTQPPAALAALPTDLCQLLLERLVAAGLLDDSVISRLSGLGLHFHSLPLGGYPEIVRPAWLRCLATASLTAADLSKTGVTDVALACLGAPPLLARLRLDYCVELTDTGLARLQGLTALQELSVVGCEQVTPVGLAHLSALTRLQRLNLQTCHAVGQLSLLSRLCHLESLDLGWCSKVGDEDAATLPCFPLLQELSLARTQVSNAGLAHLCTLTGLQVLNLSGLHVSDEALAPLLAHLPQLRSLSLDRCMQAGDRAVTAVGTHAPGLRELGLGYTAVTDQGLLQLSTLNLLTSLNLENCSITDRGLAVLSSLPSMRRLDLSDTGASNAAMPAVGLLRHLESLNLSFTGVNDVGLRKLTRLTSLRCLNLDSRLFTDAGMPSVAKLTGLECLDLFGARISEAGCASISKLSGLRRLEVCGGAVNDVGVAHLAALSSLQHLSLAQNCRVGNPSMCHLIKLNQLTALNLSQCRVTSHSVVALGCLPHLQTLALHESRVKPFAVDKLLAANPDLVVQGASATK